MNRYSLHYHYQTYRPTYNCTGSAADLCKAAMIQVEKALATRTDLQARSVHTSKHSISLNSPERGYEIVCRLYVCNVRKCCYCSENRAMSL